MTEALRLSNSKVKTFRRCEKKYEFKYVMGLKPKARAVQLERGSWVHDLLMHHYDGKDWRERHAELTREFTATFEEEREGHEDLPKECSRIMRSYLHRYRETDSGLHVVDSEVDEVVTLPNGIEFNFIIDLIVEEPDGGQWLWDHKTVKSFMDADFMLLDAQLTRYYWSAEQMGYKPRGVIFNEIRTKPPSVPALTQKGALSRAKIDTDYLTYASAIKRYGLKPNDYREQLLRLRRLDRSESNHPFFRRTRMPRDKPVTQQMMAELVMTAREIRAAEKRAQFPRTPDKACTWDCEFRDPCIIQLQGGDIRDVIKMRFTKKKRGEE